MNFCSSVKIRLTAGLLLINTLLLVYKIFQFHIRVRYKVDLNAANFMPVNAGKKSIQKIITRGPHRVHIPAIAEGKTIPKIIHQIWLGPKRIPTTFIDTWRKEYLFWHPDWQYHLWTNAEIYDMELSNKFVFDNTERLDGKADVVRYEILYRHGGIYIDADTVYLTRNNKSLDDFLKFSKNTGFFVGQEPMPNARISNSVIGSTPGHFVMKEIIEKLEANWEIHTQDPVAATGPIFLTKVISHHPFNVTILPAIYFFPQEWRGITDLQLHKKIKLSPLNYMFQYGITTNDMNVP